MKMEWIKKYLCDSLNLFFWDFYFWISVTIFLLEDLSGGGELVGESSVGEIFLHSIFVCMFSYRFNSKSITSMQSDPIYIFFLWKKIQFLSKSNYLRLKKLVELTFYTKNKINWIYSNLVFCDHIMKLGITRETKEYVHYICWKFHTFLWIFTQNSGKSAQQFVYTQYLEFIKWMI